MAATTDVFDFALAKEPKPFESYRPALRRVNASRTGKKFVLVKGDVLEFQAKFTVAFPQPDDSARDLADMITFADDHKALAFLYMPYTGISLRREVTNYAATAGQTVFAFKHRYLDAGSVKVYKDGIEQTSGWTLSGNNTAPIVTFSVAPGVSTIRIEANFLVPVIFIKNPMQEGAGITDRKDGAISNDAPQSFTFEIVEVEPGARWVDATGMSGA